MISFMGVSLPGGWLGVVSPWAAFRLHQWPQAHRSSTARRVPLGVTHVFAAYAWRCSREYIRRPMTARSWRHKVSTDGIQPNFPHFLCCGR
jgi:hypothetical protein